MSQVVSTTLHPALTFTLDSLGSAVFEAYCLVYNLSYLCKSPFILRLEFAREMFYCTRLASLLKQVSLLFRASRPALTGVSVFDITFSVSSSTKVLTFRNILGECYIVKV